MVSRGKILIVDDEVDTVGLIKTLLKKEGYDIISAGKGEEGLIKANQDKPDLILIDIRLPGMDGNNLLKMIKDKNPRQAVIMISAYADVDNAITSLKFGADDFIRKPFDNAHLIHLVNKSFERTTMIKEKDDMKKKYDKLLKGKRLSEKEKLALYGLTAYPDLSDKEVSDKINMSRTTLTGIKNKLKRKGAYRAVNVPNFGALGFELVSIIAFELNPSLSQSRSDLSGGSNLINRKGVVYAQLTDLEGLLVCVFSDYTEYKREMEPALNELDYGKYFKRLYVHHFPMKLSRFVRFMDFSPLLRRLFDIKGVKETSTSFMGASQEKELSKTEAMLLKALAAYPERSDAEVAKKVSLSRARVSQVKKKLLECGLMKRMILPELGALGVSLLSTMSVGVNPRCSPAEKKKLAEKMRPEPSTIFSVLSDTELLNLNVIRDYDHYKEVYDSINKIGKDTHCAAKDMDTVLLTVENIKSTRIDFAAIIAAAQK